MSIEQQEPCPQCAGTGKRWKMLDGRDVCDECWMDTMMDIQAAHYRSAASNVKQVEPSIPKSSRSPAIRPNPGTVQTLTTRNLKSSCGGLDDLGKKGSPSKPPLPYEYAPNRKLPSQARWRKVLAEIIKPGWNSQCLLCSRWYYGAVLELCSRCGGRCTQHTDHALGLMGRHPAQFIERPT